MMRSRPRDPDGATRSPRQRRPPCGAARPESPTLGGAVLPLVHGALVLQPVVLEIQLLVLGDVLQREQQRGLLNVGVVARAPFDLRQRRIGAEPLLARYRRPWTHFVG